MSKSFSSGYDCNTTIIKEIISLEDNPYIVFENKNTHIYFEFTEDGLIEKFKIERNDINSDYFKYTSIINDYLPQLHNNRIMNTDNYGSVRIFNLENNGLLERKFGSLIFKNKSLSNQDLQYLLPFQGKLLGPSHFHLIPFKDSVPEK